MKPRHVPVSPIALGIGVVVLLLAAFAPAHADAAESPGPAGPTGRTQQASISVP